VNEGLLSPTNPPLAKEVPPVEITVSARNTEISPALREAVEEKLGRLSRKTYGLDRADVHFFEERNPRIAERETCEITLDGHGRLIHCRVTGSDSFVVIDRATAKLEQQLEKAKTKVMRRRSTAARRSVERRQATNGSNGNGRKATLPKAI
jgi:ribosome hibernation promoting factor